MFGEDSLHVAILVMLVGVIGKIIWDWLTNRTVKQNGVHEAERMEHIITMLEDMKERQIKIWDSINRLGGPQVQIVNRQQDGPK